MHNNLIQTCLPFILILQSAECSQGEQCFQGVDYQLLIYFLIYLQQMTSTQKPNRKLKILCMHGFGTNKEFMKMQTEILRKDMQSIAELIYVNAPYEVPLAIIDDPKVAKNIVGKPYSWFNNLTNDKTMTSEEILAKNSAIRTQIQSASDYYDGALCFSQGSYTFQILLWYHLRGIINWPIITNMKFFINFSADSFRIDFKSMNYKRFEIPSLHFLSEQDFLFHRCIVSPTLYKDPEIIYHSFGHRFPVLGITQKEQLRAFLKRHGFGQSGKQRDMKESRL